MLGNTTTKINVAFDDGEGGKQIFFFYFYNLAILLR